MCRQEYTCACHSVVFSGSLLSVFAETTAEDTDALLLDLFVKRLDVDIDYRDIALTHRVGRVQQPGKDSVSRPPSDIYKLQTMASGIRQEENTESYEVVCKRRTDSVPDSRVWTQDRRI